MMYEAPQPTPQIAAAWRELESEMQAMRYGSCGRCGSSAVSKTGKCNMCGYDNGAINFRTAIAAVLTDLDAVLALVADSDPMTAVMLRDVQARLRQAMEGTSDAAD